MNDNALSSASSPSPSLAPMAAPPRLPLDSLPSELLTIIFAYVPKRPRFLVVSLVCKRWRRAVLQSPVHLHKNLGQRVNRALKHVNCRSMVCATHVAKPPASLRTLVIGKAPRNTCYCERFCGPEASLTGLTSLTMDTNVETRCECYAALIPANTHLTDLSFKTCVRRNKAATLAAFLGSTRLPALCRLSITLVDTSYDAQPLAASDPLPAALLSFLDAHRSQVTYLSLLNFGSPLLRPLFDAPLPLLVHMELKHDESTPFYWPRLGLACTRLDSLWLNYGGYREQNPEAEAEIYANAPRFLTGLRLGYRTAVKVAHFTRLRSLHVGYGAKLPSLETVLPALTELDTRSHASFTFDLLAQATALTRLNWLAAIESGERPASFCLPRVRVLHVDLEGVAKDRRKAVRLLTALPSMFPNATTLSLGMHGTSRVEVTALGEMLAREDARRTIRRIYLGEAVRDFMPADIDPRRFRWLDVRIGNAHAELRDFDYDELEDVVRWD